MGGVGGSSRSPLTPAGGLYIASVNPSAILPPAARSTGPVPFRTVSRVLPSGDPEAFLRVLQGQPRGFWARGPRWAVHAGVLGEVRVPGGGDRFRRVAEAASGWGACGGDEDAVRFYGGFAFREDHQPADRWGGFPPALFHLPAVEFDGQGDGAARLRVRVPVGDDGGGALARAEGVLDELVARMSAAPGGRSSGEVVPVPGTRTGGERERWLAAVEEALAAVRDGRFSKAVLARILDVELASAIPAEDILMALWNQHHRAHAFLFEPAPGRLLLGAAPEVLVTLRDGSIEATAVAGSAPRGATAAEDEELAAGLLASRKDRAEHRAVVEAMVAHLEALAGDVETQPTPHILTLARIQHLETEVTAVAREGLTALELVERLHPTPAVCGVPRGRALAFLSGAEPFQRGWYAGPVGWFDTEGEGHFVPALRTAVGDGRRWRLFAGAGIVEGSEPASEWEETGMKFQPILRALAEAGADVADGGS